MHYLTIILKVLLILFAVFLFIDFLTVLLTYCICWYEKSNENPKLVEKRFRGKSLKLVLKLMIPEMIFNCFTVMMIPPGMFNRDTSHLQRGETPTILLHGLFDNQGSWFWFKLQLRKSGIRNIVTINLSSWHNEEILTEILAKKIDEIRLQIGVNKVNLVGHSMGGIIARNYAQLRGGADKVDKIVCLGSPHQGSKLATFTFAPLGKVLIPSTDFLTRLNKAPIPAHIKMTNIYSNKDNMVQPNRFNYLHWGTAIELDDMGHTSLIYRKAPIMATISALKGFPQE